MTARRPRTWRLRRRRGDSGRPLTAEERRIAPEADLPVLAAAVVRQALDDLDAGCGPGGKRWGANNRMWRAQAYLWFFYGAPTGFERYMARLGAPCFGRLPPHPLLDSAAALAARRGELARLGLPGDLFDGRIAALGGEGDDGAAAAAAEHLQLCGALTQMDFAAMGRVE